MVFELVDLEELGERALHDFTQFLAAPPIGSGSLDFDQAASNLVTKVEFTYAVAAKLAHREATMEGTAAIWTKVVGICDQIAAELKRLEQKYPGSTAPYDRVLDLRNAAERRRALHA